MITLGFSLPRPFLRLVDRRAISLGMDRTNYIYQVVRRYVLFPKERQQFYILPCARNLRDGGRACCNIRCEPVIKANAKRVANRYSMSLSELIFQLLRTDVLEGGEHFNVKAGR